MVLCPPEKLLLFFVSLLLVNLRIHRAKSGSGEVLKVILGALRLFPECSQVGPKLCLRLVPCYHAPRKKRSRFDGNPKKGVATNAFAVITYSLGLCFLRVHGISFWKPGVRTTSLCVTYAHLFWFQGHQSGSLSCFFFFFTSNFIVVEKVLGSHFPSSFCV